MMRNSRGTTSSDEVIAGILDRRAVQGIAAGLAASLVSFAALAQTTGPVSPASQPGELEEITVTGTMIKRVNAETAESITILKADQLKELGVTNVEQALNQLTSSNASINTASSVGTFSGGGSYANLRGLGSGRTLVLIDGERIAPNAFNGNGIDINSIPFSAVDTVEVLHEGASALYGSDAIAGVINFKTKRNFQGGEINVNFDRPQETGGGNGSADFAYGHGDLNSDGYNFMITGNYSKQQELQATQRPFSAQGFYPGGGASSTNYPGSWPGNVQDANGNLYQSGYPACAGNPQLTRYYGDCTYRYSAATDLLPESHETSGMASFTKTLPANNQIQLQYFWTQSEVNSYSGPEFYDFTMNPASPYFPTAGQLTCNRGAANCSAPVDLVDPINAIWTDPNNSRYGGNLNTAQRILLTFTGKNGGWDYKGSLNYSQYVNDNRNTGGVPNEAVLAPGGVLSTLINPFGPQSAAGQALINSAYVNGVYEVGKDRRWSVDGNASHELGDAFDAGTPATFALGFTVNGEYFNNYTTPYNDLVQSATGLSDSNTEGSRQVQALFFELDVPITKGLDLDVSDREDRYSDFGRTNNGKISVRYQPTSYLTLRGTASTGFRAPTLYNLYAPAFLSAASSGTMGQGNPFCAPGAYTAEWTPSTCESQGIGLYGGNKNLTPETSQNFDFGIVLSPVENLGITLDFYRILLKNTVSNIPSSAIYGNPTTFASSITTATAGAYAGTLPPTIAEANVCQPYTLATCGYISEQYQNTGRITTDGFDLSVQYLQQTAIGTFHEDLEGTAVTQFLEQQYSGGPSLNLVGNLQISEINPAYRWEHNVHVDWTSPGKMWGGGLSDRFYSGYVDEFPDLSGNLRHVGNYNLVDGFAKVNPVENLTVLVGIKNLFNTSPPFTNANQNNFTQGYNALTADPLLRNFYLNLKYTF